MAFVNSFCVPFPSPSVQTSRHPRTLVCLHGDSSPTHPTLSRRQLLTVVGIGAASTLASALLATPPAFAADQTSNGFERAISKALFPKSGFTAPDAVIPSEKVIDRAILSQPQAKAALQKLRVYDEAINSLFSKFKQDPQLELSNSVKNLVSISDLRSALNIVSEAIDEETQKATDKVVRGIIQDIGELENAANLKPGSTRTAKKIVRTTDWFETLTGDFKRLLSFYS